VSAELDGKVVAITGASRGIGRVTAAVLARRGARVALLARSQEALAEAASEIGEAALPIPTDIGDPDSVRSAFAQIESEFGRLDALVNNAVVAWPQRLEDATDEALRASVDTNLLGVLYCSRAAIPLLRGSGGGDIVNLSSESVRQPFPMLSVYAATKGAVEMLSFALKRELNPDGIRVTLLRSGAVATAGFVGHWDPEQGAEAFRLWQEGGFFDWIGVPMEPESVAEAIVFAITRPAGVGVDVMELRSSAVPGSATTQTESDD
jgi:meso-butanediol dehydrogenase/(S,S)-butanediol dehydrogenase/diacetyl reductase